MKNLTILLAFLIPVFSVNIHAQKKTALNLHQAIQMALDSNLSVRSSAYSVDVQKALKGASWSVPKTSVQGQYGQFNSYSKDNSFTISQSFSFPSVYINQYKLANAQIKSSEWDLKSTRLDIASQVKQIYWQLSYLNSKQKLFLWQDSLYSGFLKAAEMRLKTGETNRLEMITARSQSMELKNQLQQINSDINNSKQKMQTLLNTDVDFTLTDSVLIRADYLPVFDSLTLKENPAIGFQNQQVEISHFETKLEKSQLLPEFNIGYSSLTMTGVQDVNGVSRTFGLGNRFSYIQAGVSVPLWFVPYASKIKAAKLKEQFAKTTAEHYTKSLSSNYKSLLNDYVKYNNSVDYYEKQVLPEADLIIDQATKSYHAGALDYLDYIQNLSRALIIKQNYIESLNSYNQTIISIEYITGHVY